jgi:HAD-superfamily, subfamily-IB PSPase-like hydrolase, archaeal
LAKNFKVFVTDIDGVITNIDSIWQYVHDKLNVSKIARINYELYHSGKIDYVEWARRDIELWKGVKYDDFMKIIKSVEIRKGSEELFNYLHTKKLKIIAISGGLLPLLQYLNEMFHFTFFIANEISFENGVVSGKFRINVKPHNKGRILKKILQKLNISNEECIGIGDSQFDMPMLRYCGYSIGFNPKDKRLFKICDTIIKSNTLFEVLNKIKELIE